MQLAGTWYNELKSSMTLVVAGNVLSGTYHNAAGPAAGDYDLYGIVDPDATVPNRTIAWVVQWTRKADAKNFNSVTAWSGQLQLLGTKKIPTITTEWLLTAATDPADDWASTHVGQDVFTQTPPSATSVKLKIKSKAPSHPRK
jgi:hypothetical protein